MSETILSITCFAIILAGAIKPFLKIKPSILLNILFVIGMTISAALLIAEAYSIDELSIGSVFKLYLIASASLFLFSYSKKHGLTELVSILGIVLSSCLIISAKTDIMMFCSMSMLVISTYTFCMTRERLSNNDNIIAIYAIISFILLYKVSPFISLTCILAIISILFIKVQNRDINTLIMNIIFPMIAYLFIKELSQATQKEMTQVTLMLTGVTMMITAAASIISIKKESINRQRKYGLFYMGNILLFLSLGTSSSVSIAIILVLIIPVVYYQHLNPISTISMGMLPLSTTFIAKTAFMGYLIKQESWILLGLTSISSLVFWIYGSYDLIRTKDVKYPETPTGHKWTILYIFSIVIIIASAIFFNYIQDVLKIGLEGLLRV